MAKILVIDDEDFILRYFTRVLTSLKHEVVTAAESSAGCQIAKNDTGIQIIFTDLAMPGPCSDVALVTELRKLRPECPLVVISGHPTPARLAECERLGVRDFLTKPFELGFISGVINRLLGATNSARQA